MASPSTLTPAFDYGPIERYATGGDDLQPKIDELQMRAHKLLSEAVAMRRMPSMRTRSRTSSRTRVICSAIYSGRSGRATATTV